MRYRDATGAPDTSTICALLRAGFIDIGAAIDADRVSTAPGAGFTDTEFVPFRSDYFMATTRLARRATAYRVLRTPVTDAASDHYPITAVFRTGP